MKKLFLVSFIAAQNTGRIDYDVEILHQLSAAWKTGLSIALRQVLRL